MALPKQVQKQVDEAEQLAEQLGLAPDESEATPSEPADVVELTPPEQQVAGVSAGDVDPAAAPVGDTPAPKEPQSPAPDFEARFAKLEQQHKTLQGKYEAETGRMRDENSKLNGHVEQLTTMLGNMQAPQDSGPDTPAVDTSITQQELQDYGEDLIDLIGRKAASTVQPIIDGLMKRVYALENDMGDVNKEVTLTAKEKLYKHLDDNVKDWRQVNQSEGFMNWLNEVDPYAGDMRGHLLRSAFDANDASRVVAFFKGYLKEQTVVAAGVGQPQTTEATPQRSAAGAAEIDLETLVTPAGATEATSTSALVDKAGKVWTEADIATFYSEVQRGRYRGREAEKDRIEADIIAAGNQGRIR